MLKRLLVVLIVPSFLLFGCVIQQTQPKRYSPTLEQVQEAEATGKFGPQITDLDRMAHAYLDTKLKDPYTVMDFRILEGPRKAWLYGPLGGGRYGFRWGWSFPVQYNAKNSYGAYTGIKVHILFAWGGEVFAQDPFVGPQGGFFGVI